MKKILKKEKGITLVALVITIIILLILAGITIAALSESGLFDKSQQAKVKASEAETTEDMKIKLMEAQIDIISSGKDSSDLTLIANYLNTNYGSNVDTTIIINYMASVTINTNGITKPSALKIEYNDYGFAVDKKGSIVESLTTSLETDKGRETFNALTANTINTASSGTNNTENSSGDEYKVGDQVKVGNENFYVYEDSAGNSNTVKLIAKYCLKKDQLIQASSASEDTASVFSSDKYWENSQNIISDEWGELVNINNETGYEDNDAMGKIKRYAQSIGAQDGILPEHDNSYLYTMTFGEDICYWSNESYISNIDLVRIVFKYDHTNKKYDESYRTSTDGDIPVGVRPVVIIEKTKVTKIQ